jgi:hypothetical protein
MSLGFLFRWLGILNYPLTSDGKDKMINELEKEIWNLKEELEVCEEDQDAYRLEAESLKIRSDTLLKLISSICVAMDCGELQLVDKFLELKTKEKQLDKLYDIHNEDVTKIDLLDMRLEQSKDENNLLKEDNNRIPKLLHIIEAQEKQLEQSNNVIEKIDDEIIESMLSYKSLNEKHQEKYEKSGDTSYLSTINRNNDIITELESIQSILSQVKENKNNLPSLSYSEHSIKCQLRIDYTKETGFYNHLDCMCKCHGESYLKTKERKKKD